MGLDNYGHAHALPVQTVCQRVGEQHVPKTCLKRGFLAFAEIAAQLGGKQQFQLCL